MRKPKKKDVTLNFNSNYGNINFKTKGNQPHSLWIIHDPESGPKYFFEKREADGYLKSLKKIAHETNDKDHPVYKMSKPLRYLLDHSSEKKQYAWFEKMAV